LIPVKGELALLRYSIDRIYTGIRSRPRRGILAIDNDTFEGGVL
jgi:hypothetical protein